MEDKQGREGERKGGNCLRVLRLCTDTMIKVTLVRITFSWGWLTGSEVQSIIIKAGTWQHLGRNGAGGTERSTSSSEDYKLGLGY